MTSPRFTQLVAEDIQTFEKIFKKELRTGASLLNLVTSYILKTKGKQLRPTMVFLGAKLFGEVKDATYSAAFMIELMHTATLLHDDVVDNSMRRRGFFSVNALWKNKIGVLVGDYFLAKGLLHALEKKEHRMLEIISNAVKEMSEGELIQIEKARSLKNTEEVYFDIIKKKTASLFVSSLLSGAHSSGNLKEEDEAKVSEMAEALGIAFQIKDDLLDYTKTSITGKPSWNDLREQKQTLPLLYALKQVPTNEAKHIKKLLRTHKNKTEKLQQIVTFVENNGGIEYAIKIMNEYCEKAKSICSSFPKNDAQEAIIELIDFVATRKK